MDKLRQNKTLVRFLDICMIIIILSNLSAVFITNYMVMKTMPEVEIVEANPIMGEIHDLEVHPNWWEVIKPFLLHIGLLGLLFGHYLWIRNTNQSRLNLKCATYVYGVITVLFLFDFINDLGYLIGGI